MVNCKNLSERSKWVISLYMILLFLLIASPMMYKVTNKLTELIGWESSDDGCANWSGLLLHAIVFGLLVRAMMLIRLPGEEKFRISTHTGTNVKGGK